MSPSLQKQDDKRNTLMPKGWKSWELEPPKEGEHIVRRMISDMEALYSSKYYMTWGVVNSGSIGALKYMWKPYKNYLRDENELTNTEK